MGNPLVYFLVNNDYQLFDARRHARALLEKGIASSLIEVPHALGEGDRSCGFASVATIASPLRSHRWVGAWLRYFAAPITVLKVLHPGAGDVLFLYTEYELINHFVVRRFKRAGARVYLIEDGGVGTYLPFSLSGNEVLSTKQRIVATMTRCLPGLWQTRFHKVNSVVFPWMRDSSIDGLCLYRPLRIVRRFPVYVLRNQSHAPIDPICGRVIFLNERMYDDYQTIDQHVASLVVILESLVAGFAEVFFKFHPREDVNSRTRLRVLIATRFPEVRIIESQRAVEALLIDYRPEVIASFFSTALLNLDGTRIEPMFLFQMIPELANQRLFVQLKALLAQWECNLVASWSEACSGYRSGLNLENDAAEWTLDELVARTRPTVPSQVTLPNNSAAPQ